MEKEEINSRIKSLILYSDHVERSDIPHEIKLEKLEEIYREKMFLENILDERKFQAFLKEYIIGLSVMVFVCCVLMFLILYYER
jgi:hypothetical protein